MLVSRPQTYFTGHGSGMGLSEFSAGGDTCSEQGIGDGSLGTTHTSKSSCRASGDQRALLFWNPRGSGRGCRYRSTPLKSVKVWIFTHVSPGLQTLLVTCDTDTYTHSPSLNTFLGWMIYSFKSSFTGIWFIYSIPLIPWLIHLNTFKPYYCIYILLVILLY